MLRVALSTDFCLLLTDVIPQSKTSSDCITGLTVYNLTHNIKMVTYKGAITKKPEGKWDAGTIHLIDGKEFTLGWDAWRNFQKKNMVWVQQHDQSHKVIDVVFDEILRVRDANGVRALKVGTANSPSPAPMGNGTKSLLPLPSHSRKGSSATLRQSIVSPESVPVRVLR